MLIELRNEFHGTTTRVRATSDGKVGARAMRRAYQALCGNQGERCTCAARPYDLQGRQLPVIFQGMMEGLWFEATGERPTFAAPKAEFALRMTERWVGEQAYHTLGWNPVRRGTMLQVARNFCPYKPEGIPWRSHYGAALKRIWKQLETEARLLREQGGNPNELPERPAGHVTATLFVRTLLKWGIVEEVRES
jgi:hypothetical protein